MHVLPVLQDIGTFLIMTTHILQVHIIGIYEEDVSCTHIMSTCYESTLHVYI